MATPPDAEMRTRSLEERVSRLEGGYEHVATKADVERVITEFRTEVGKLRTEVERNRADIIKIIIQLAGVGMALLAVGFAFLRLTGAA